MAKILVVDDEITMVQMVTELDCQLVITSLDPELQVFGQPERVFHVEQGVVTQR